MREIFAFKIICVSSSLLLLSACESGSVNGYFAPDPANNSSSASISSTSPGSNSDPTSNTGSGGGAQSPSDPSTSCLSVNASLVALSNSQCNANTAVTFSGNASVQGSVVLLGDSTLNAAGNVSVDGVYGLSESQIQTSGKSVSIGGFVSESSTALSQEQQSVMAFVQSLEALTPTAHYGSILESGSDSLSILGNGGVNVIEIENGIDLSGQAALTLSGSSSDEFIFLIKNGGVSLSGKAEIALANDTSASNVIFVIEGDNPLSLAGNGTVVGTFVDPQGPTLISGNGTIQGAVFASGAIALSGNGLVMQAAPFCPSPPANDGSGSSGSTSGGTGGSTGSGGPGPGSILGI